MGMRTNTSSWAYFIWWTHFKARGWLSKTRAKGCLRASSCIVTQLYPTFCNPRDGREPDSSVHGIFQTRILEWISISFSRGSFWLKDQTHVSYIGRQILYHWTSHQGSPWGLHFTIWQMLTLGCLWVPPDSWNRPDTQSPQQLVWCQALRTHSENMCGVGWMNRQPSRSSQTVGPGRTFWKSMNPPPT